MLSGPRTWSPRAGAKPGDAVTGPLGGAAAGCCSWTGPSSPQGIEAGIAEAMRARQLRPRARLDAGRALAAAGASAMIDVSDGLGADAGHLAAASGARIEVDVGAVAVQPGVSEVAMQRRARTRR